MNTIIYKIFYSLQKYLALLCGFGYGSYSIKKEFNQSNSFLKKSKNSFLFIDVGGNEGLYAAEIRKKYPKAHIHIFEPAKYNYDYLVAKFKMDNAIHIVKSAISSESCEAVLYMDRLGSGLASLSNRRLNHFNINFDINESVTLIKFEDYWRDKLHSSYIDLIKIDVEGHELLALEGFGEAINHVGVIQFEFGGCNIDSRTYFQDFWYFFKEKGFVLHRITPFGPSRVQNYSEFYENFTTTNYIAVKKYNY